MERNLWIVIFILLASHVSLYANAADSNGDIQNYQLAKIVELSHDLHGLRQSVSFNELVKMGSDALVGSAIILNNPNISNKDKSSVSYFVGLRCAVPNSVGYRARMRLTNLLPVESIHCPAEVVVALTSAIESETLV
jgi:hypothetical protein